LETQIRFSVRRSIRGKPENGRLKVCPTHPHHHQILWQTHSWRTPHHRWTRRGSWSDPSGPRGRLRASTMLREAPHEAVTPRGNHGNPAPDHGG